MLIIKEMVEKINSSVLKFNQISAAFTLKIITCGMCNKVQD